MFDETESNNPNDLPDGGVDRQVDASGRAESDVAPLPAEMTELIDLADRRRQLDVREAELLARIDASGVTVPHTGHHTAPWFANATRLPRNAAGRRVHVARELHAHHPAIAKALADGRLSWAHADAWVRAVNHRVRPLIGPAADHLIEAAQHSTYERWAQELRGVADLLDQDGGHNPLGDTARNQLHLSELTDGVTRLSGEFVGELALIVRAHLEAATEAVMRRYHRDFDESGDLSVLPARSQARAEALVELLERANATDESTTTAPEPDLIVHYDTNRDELTDQTGEHINPAVMRWLIAAAIIRPMATTGRGDPLRLGRTLRYANRAQRRALVIRDGGCIFPGCTRPPAWCDAHHPDTFEHGGATDIENLALLCRHHHRLTHRPRWAMERWHHPDEPAAVLFRWTTPFGNTLYSQRHQTRIEPPPQASAA